MGSKVGRYSGYLRPLTFVVDWTILILLAYAFSFDSKQWAFFSLYAVFSWIIISIKTDYYEVYRFTKTLRIISLAVTQFVGFTLVVVLYFNVFSNTEYASREIFNYLGRIFLLIFLFSCENEGTDSIKASVYG